MSWKNSVFLLNVADARHSENHTYRIVEKRQKKRKKREKERLAEYFIRCEALVIYTRESTHTA